MKRVSMCFSAFSAVAALCCLVFGPPAAWAESAVRMTGDARIHANWFSMPNFTGWNYDGKGTGDPLTIWQRFRLRTDFQASDQLGFRLGLRVDNTPWGHGTLTAANPQVAVQVYEAYLRFYLPDSPVRVTAGLQNTDLPISSAYFNANPVLGGARAAALIVDAPVYDDLISVTAGFSRLVDANRTYDPTTTQVADETDLYFLALPVTAPSFTLTPWAAVGVIGAGTNTDLVVGGPGDDHTLSANILSSGTLLSPSGWRNGQNAYVWVGGALEVRALDPFRFYADAVYGQGAMADAGKNRRQGLFLDAAVDYRGFSFLLPTLAGWYSTGEDGSTTNGSERLPVLVGSWGPGASFLFDDGQELANDYLGVNPIGTWGLALTLDKMSFVPGLSHKVTVAHLRGLNSLSAVLEGFNLWGVCSYYQMGRDLVNEQYVTSVTVNHRYVINDNLSLIAETGWANGNFKRPGFCRRHVNQALSGDPWMVSLGAVYRF